MPSDLIGKSIIDSLTVVAVTWAKMPVIWFIVVVLITVAICRLPAGKGWFGEKVVSLLLRWFLDKRVYRLVDDVTIPDDEGGTTQIDHVVFSPYGIFVIETKNMGGWIFGSEKDRMWTQKMHGNHSQKFQNPLRQNYKHTKTLAGILGIPHEVMVSIVVLVGNGRFRTDMPANVTYGLGCVQFIKSHRNEVLALDQVAELVKGIGELRLERSLKTHREHVAHLKERHDKVPASVAAGAKPSPAAIAPLGVTPPDRDAKDPVERHCPKCGSLLVARTARKGANAGNPFWGCSGFPQCRFTETNGAQG